MAEREERLARASEGLLARRSPPPGAEARVLAALEASLGPLGGGGLAVQGGGGQAIWWAKIVGTTLAMTSAGLGLLRTVVVVGGLESQPPLHERGNGPEQGSHERSEAAPAPTPAVVPVPEVREASDPPTSRERSSAGATKVEHAGVVEAEQNDATIDADALAGELALMRSIRSEPDALARLDLLARHEREYPRGHMADERQALQAIAECELGRMSEGRVHLERLRETRPSSPLLDRVELACPGS